MRALAGLVLAALTVNGLPAAAASPVTGLEAASLEAVAILAGARTAGMPAVSGRPATALEGAVPPAISKPWSVYLPKPGSSGQPPQGSTPRLAAKLDLSAQGILNRYWGTPLSYTLGGETVHFSGVFDKDENAYLNVWSEKWAEPKFFSVLGLLAPTDLQVGGQNYRIKIKSPPNLKELLKNKLVVSNKADKSDSREFTVEQLLEGVRGRASQVRLSDQTYEVFFSNDVKMENDEPVLDPQSRTYTFLYLDGAVWHLFLIPENLVPDAKVAIFKMFKDKRVGLRRSGDELHVYEGL